MAKVLGRNQGPTVLDRCQIDNSVLADGLRGNSRLGKFITRLSNNFEVSNREALAIADALRENQGLVNLTFGMSGFWGEDFRNDVGMSNEAWDAVCDSLKTHPTLRVLNIFGEAPFAPAVMVGGVGLGPIAPDVITFRTQALLDMMKVNISIHTMHFHDHYRRHDIFRRSVIPYLETNRFRLRVRAIQKSRPDTYRAMVLGRALSSARTDANSFWMLLSGNAEVAFPSRTTIIAEATYLPTPPNATATAAATSTANVDVCFDDHCDW
jgi:hypothetical protein